MRSVRCDACGTKALMAASKCPKCRNPIQIRDGFGELFKLAHCPSCDSYYPESLGSCKWCGTRPERAPVTPLIWKTFGGLAFVAMAWGAWLVHDDPSEAEQAARMRALLKPDSSATVAIVDSSSTRTTTFVSESGTVVVDSGSIPTSVVATADSVVQAMRVAEPDVEATPAERPHVTRAPTGTRESPPARAVDRPVPRATKKSAPKTPPRAVAAAKAPPKSVAKATPTASKKSARKSSSRWVTTTSRSWVIVRASASPGARIIASVGPNTRVQLGESKGGWRRIKAKGLAGWVEHRLFYAGAGTPRGNRFAAR